MATWAADIASVKPIPTGFTGTSGDAIVCAAIATLAVPTTASVMPSVRAFCISSISVDSSWNRSSTVRAALA
jgi:hypothetical protein